MAAKNTDEDFDDELDELLEGTAARMQPAAALRPRPAVLARAERLLQ